MPVDLAFELSYLLSDYLGEVAVENVEFDPETGMLCVDAVVGGARKRGCIEVKACRGLRDPGKQARCLSKTLSVGEKLVRELAEKLKG